MQTRELLIHDTTLRDGEQGIGNEMTLTQKAAILEQLDRLPLDLIEIGFPAASQEDLKWARMASTMSMRAKPVVLVRPIAEDLKKTISATEKFAAIQYLLLGTGSEIHQQKKRRLPLGRLLDEIANAVDLLRSAGRVDISVILEDASRGSADFLRTVATQMSALGVRSITFADTVGYAVPAEIEAMLCSVRHSVDPNIALGIHCHNDLGLATANTLTAISCGASIIQGTMGGLGERAGNCALEEVITILQYKKQWQVSNPGFDLRDLHDVAHQIHRILNKSISPTKPILGEHVFSTAAGIHQNGLLKSPEIYEYVKPQDFGRQRKLIFNRLSGRTMLNATLGNMNEVEMARFTGWLLGLKEEVEANRLQHYFERFKQSECRTV
jgi:2-isopropylmalate synthase